ncbi:uncharacterized protein [Triticum aestivum]|uniref:uncharacterized protein isoform X3 n=1 Tax=Triticum aestivum TaxID=4565 RepID=UPI001D0117BB|nr:uncharacterized protein LOC123123839 isoform X3 [Triticum aestivum]
MSTNSLSLIDMPLAWSVNANASILVVMEDDSLGFAHVDGLILNLWSRHMGSDGVASWTQRAVMDIKDILPIRNPNKRLRLIGSVEGTDIIFVTTDLGIYKINLKSLQWNKVCGMMAIRRICWRDHQRRCELRLGKMILNLNRTKILNLNLKKILNLNLTKILNMNLKKILNLNRKKLKCFYNPQG